MQNKINNNSQPNKNSKKTLTRALITLGVVAIVLTIIGFAIYQVMQTLDEELRRLMRYVDLLNRPVNMATLIVNPIQQGDFDSFVAAANASGFDVFDKDGLVDISSNDATVTLERFLALSDRQFGAFLNAVVNLDVVEIREFTITELEDNRFQLRNVTELDFTKVASEIHDILPQFPERAFITTISVVEVIENIIEITSTQVTINQLTGQENTDVVAFINQLFPMGDQEYSFTEIVSFLAREAAYTVFRKAYDESDTVIMIELLDGGISFTPNTIS